MWCIMLIDLPERCGGRLQTACPHVTGVEGGGARIQGLRATSGNWERQRNRVSPFWPRKAEPHYPRPERAPLPTGDACCRLACSFTAVSKASLTCSHSDSQGRPLFFPNQRTPQLQIRSLLGEGIRPAFSFLRNVPCFQSKTNYACFQIL